MTEQQIAAMRQALEKAYLAGFMASGEGYNGEYPFSDCGTNPPDEAAWLSDRDKAITALTAALTEESSGTEQPAQQELCPSCRNGDIYACTCTFKQAQQQEPVAWMNAKRDMTYLHGPYNADDIPPYDHPQAREPLLREIAALSANALDDYKTIQKLMAERQPLTEEMEKQASRHLGPHRKSAFRDGWRSAEQAHGITSGAATLGEKK